jgi:hypothetical protein
MAAPNSIVSHHTLPNFFIFLIVNRSIYRDIWTILIVNFQTSKIIIIGLKLIMILGLLQRHL